MQIDRTDLKILQALQQSGKISNAELAKHVNLSPSPCLARVKRLEQSGIIKQYVALLDPKLAGLELNVFVFIT